MVSVSSEFTVTFPANSNVLFDGKLGNKVHTYYVKDSNGNEVDFVFVLNGTDAKMFAGYYGGFVLPYVIMIYAQVYNGSDIGFGAGIIYSKKHSALKIWSNVADLKFTFPSTPTESGSEYKYGGIRVVVIKGTPSLSNNVLTVSRVDGEVIVGIAIDNDALTFESSRFGITNDVYTPTTVSKSKGFKVDVYSDESTLIDTFYIEYPELSTLFNIVTTFRETAIVIGGKKVRIPDCGTREGRFNSGGITFGINEIQRFFMYLDPDASVDNTYSVHYTPRRVVLLEGSQILSLVYETEVYRGTGEKLDYVYFVYNIRKDEPMVLKTVDLENIVNHTSYQDAGDTVSLGWSCGFHGDATAKSLEYWDGSSWVSLSIPTSPGWNRVEARFMRHSAQSPLYGFSRSMVGGVVSLKSDFVNTIKVATDPHEAHIYPYLPNETVSGYIKMVIIERYGDYGETLDIDKPDLMSIDFNRTFNSLDSAKPVMDIYGFNEITVYDPSNDTYSVQSPSVPPSEGAAPTPTETLQSMLNTLISTLFQYLPLIIGIVILISLIYAFIDIFRRD